MLLAAAPASIAHAIEPIDYLDLDELTYAIQVAIRDAVRDQDRDPYFLIVGISLELKGTETAGATGGFKIPIFKSTASLEAMAEYTATHALELDLSPNDPIATRPVPDIRLSEIIGSVKDSFGDAGQNGVAAEGEETGQDETDPEPEEEPGDLPQLRPKGFTYTYSGALKTAAEGGLDFIFFKIGGSIEQTSLQTIKFELCRTYNKQNCADE